MKKHAKHLSVRMPAGVGSLIKDEGPQNWGFYTTPQKHMNDRKLWWPRGKGWGGSSAINGMLYVRGHARDYDLWRQSGLTGWGYGDVAGLCTTSFNFFRGESSLAQSAWWAPYDAIWCLALELAVGAKLVDAAGR